MELIVTLLSIVGAFFASVLAHFLAHDAYGQASKYAGKLIERASHKLPSLKKDRYREEWLAGLHPVPKTPS